MSANYRIRHARENEIRLLNDIENAASTLFDNTKYALEIDQEPLSEELLREQQKKNLVWVAVDELDNPVGFAVVLILGDFAHLHELSVDPDHGRKGLGTWLAKEAMLWAKRSALKGMTLSTFRDIAWNAPFYKKLGFRDMGEGEIGEDLKKIRMKEVEMGLPVNERVLMIVEF